MYQGPIIDTHHHLWEVRNYPWLVAPPSPKIFGESYEPLRFDYLIDDLRVDFNGHDVVKSVHVQAHYDARDPVGETRWLQGVADRHGFPHRQSPGTPIVADDRVEEMLDAHAQYENFRGIRDHVMVGAESQGVAGGRAPGLLPQHGVAARRGAARHPRIAL